MPLPFSRGLPVRLVLTAGVVGAMLVMALALLIAGSVGVREVRLQAASRSALDASRITEERARRMLEPAAASVRLLVHDPLHAATSLPQRLARVPVLASELDANPLLAGLYMGYGNGDFLMVRPLGRADVRRSVDAPPGARFLVQSLVVQPDGRREVGFHFYDAALQPMFRRTEADDRFDPRERPWYRAAQAETTGGTAVSAPYVFFTTRRIGISLSRRAGDDGAVVGLDLALDDLAESLGDLRLTPGAELALVDASGRVLAYRDMQAVIERGDGDTLGFHTLEALGVASLSGLYAAPRDGRAVAYTAGEREWFGLVRPFDAIPGQALQLLVAAPADELLRDLRGVRERLVLLAGVLMLACLPIGVWVGQRLGQGLERVTARARRLSRFDFSQPAPARSLLREVGALQRVVDEVSRTVEAFLAVSRVLGTEPRIETMLEQVLQALVSAARCDGGAVYLRAAAAEGADDAGPLERAVAHGRTAGLPERLDADEPTLRALPADAGVCRAFELRGRHGALEGLLVLVMPPDRAHASPEFLAFAGRLTGMLAVAVETRRLIDAQRRLFDAVIQVLADAIDAKSAYTGGHCERVPTLASMIVDRLGEQTEGPYAGFRLDEDERYAFHLAAWLHDCGKVTSPEHIVDKATKLEVIHDRIHEVRTRFELLWRDAEIEALQARLAGADPVAADAARDAAQARLQDDFAFVAACNIGGEFLSDEAIARLQAIGRQHWQRHFDDRLGLGPDERRRLEAVRPEAPPLPALEPLLADRPEHRIPWGDARPAVQRDDPRNTLGFDMDLPPLRQDRGELHNLAVRRGTLSPEDRFAINDHIVQTLCMLKKLPWPAPLARVPDIAANHHERMDGRGYPRRLVAADLPITDRVMALADVFEALTAGDRPYKPAKPLSESLRIMAAMARDGHIDPELMRFFLASDLWRRYAERFLAPAQIDEVDVEALACACSAEAPGAGAAGASGAASAAAT
ncbi:HD domain-containing phosphohydrolase [Piscinibacter sakaiensis]|uniref:ABC-type amino acid transport, signal transduction systems, periplasmic component/domain n=1 Tax=Piscinibacter sakaiensis TaxID=1547922 RepID=A0A0K8NXQ9_PISS1|nr:HD domain-containing phosphohydrolase [Piscinibacter sakaiensis]GAP35099.1 ABC-type amino acid transport, signal transduction systems, periplasmic component/domain [Piscinibacter sakaiensis]